MPKLELATVLPSVTRHCIKYVFEKEVSPDLLDRLEEQTEDQSAWAQILFDTIWKKKIERRDNDLNDAEALKVAIGYLVLCMAPHIDSFGSSDERVHLRNNPPALSALIGGVRNLLETYGRFPSIQPRKTRTKLFQVLATICAEAKLRSVACEAFEVYFRYVQDHDDADVEPMREVTTEYFPKHRLAEFCTLFNEYARDVLREGGYQFWHHRNAKISLSKVLTTAYMRNLDTNSRQLAASVALGIAIGEDVRPDMLKILSEWTSILKRCDKYLSKIVEMLKARGIPVGEFAVELFPVHQTEDLVEGQWIQGMITISAVNGMGTNTELEFADNSRLKAARNYILEMLKTEFIKQLEGVKVPLQLACLMIRLKSHTTIKYGETIDLRPYHLARKIEGGGVGVVI